MKNRKKFFLPIALHVILSFTQPRLPITFHTSEQVMSPHTHYHILPQFTFDFFFKLPKSTNLYQTLAQ